MPFSVPSERPIASGALRLVVQTEEDNDPALRLYTDSGYALINGYCSLMLPIRPEARGKLMGPPGVPCHKRAPQVRGGVRLSVGGFDPGALQPFLVAPVAPARSASVASRRVSRGCGSCTPIERRPQASA